MLSGTPDDEKPIGEVLSGIPDDENLIGEVLLGTPDDENLIGEVLSGTPDDENLIGEVLSGTPDDENLIGEVLSGTPDDENLIWESAVGNSRQPFPKLHHQILKKFRPHGLAVSPVAKAPSFAGQHFVPRTPDPTAPPPNHSRPTSRCASHHRVGFAPVRP